MTQLLGFATATLVAGLITAPAAAQSGRAGQEVKLSPYIEAAQVLDVNVNNGDVLTYTQVSAGIDATVSNRRMTATIAARYDHNFSENKKVADQDVVTGLAKASIVAAPGFTVDGGAIATRSRTDIRGGVPGLTQGNLTNTSDVVSADIGPSYAGHAGPIGIAATYRYGGTKVSSPTPKDLPPGSQVTDNYSRSQRHLATLSAGIKPGDVLPVGLSASGAYERETSDELDQKYRGYYGRGDAVLPISGRMAITGGAGYENIQISQRDPVVDGAGNPVINSRGHYISNTAAPRRIAFDTTGLFWDAGVLYKSPRTALQARVGRRYDSMTYTGSLAWQASSSVGLNVGVYDGIQSFGRQLRGGVAALPNDFIASGDTLSRNFTGCTFGQSSAQAGGCLNSAFQSITTAQYRARGVDAVLVARRGPTTLGFGAGYANRKFLLPNAGPNLVITDGSKDQSGYAQFFASEQLSANDGIDFNANAAVYDSGIPGADTVYSGGASAGYYRRMGNLGATATVGMYAFDSKSIQAQVDAQARLGLRYGF